jgi:hypothetical protein
VALCPDLGSMIPGSDQCVVDQQVKCMSEVGVHVARDRSTYARTCSNAAMQPACTMRACKPSATYTTALPASRSRWVTPSATFPQHVDKLCQRCRRAQRVCAISRAHRSPQRSSASRPALARAKRASKLEPAKHLNVSRHLAQACPWRMATESCW